MNEQNESEVSPSRPEESPSRSEESPSRPDDPSGTNEPPAPTIDLDQFLKTCGVATGGQAKLLIQGGEVLVNNEVETRRRKKLREGDEVTLDDNVFVVAFGEQ